jgi:hypothetical protein
LHSNTTPPKHRSRYHPCVQCGFNVEAIEQQCPDCGLLHPLETFNIITNDYSFLIKAVVAVTILVCAIYFGNLAGFGGVVCCALPVGIGLAFFFGTISKAIADALSKRSRESGEKILAKRRSPSPESLVYKANVIKRRTSELREREQQVKNVLKRVSENEGPQWDQVRSTLEATRQSLKRQIAQYSTKPLEIELVRLQNRVASLVYSTDTLSYAEIDDQLAVVNACKGQLANISSELQKQQQVLSDCGQVAELSQRVRDFERSMKTLQDALVGRQAVLAIKGISPLDDAIAPIAAPVLELRKSEVFNIQVAITDFSTSFQELESEYARIQTEEDVSMKIRDIDQR